MSLHRTLISAADLASLLRSPQPPVLLDLRFDLADPAAGERAYREGHLPGAHYVHLDRDLCSEKVDAQGRFRGRHPLPTREAFAREAGTLGIRPGRQVVAYDNTGGMYASRLWWMLRWIGHEEVAVLDGGIAAWTAAGGALDTDAPSRDTSAAPLPLGATTQPTVEAEELLAHLQEFTVLDARAPERYRGEVEPLDRVAGHIPGALNRFYQHNLQADGRFKPATELRAAFESLAATGKPLVHHCGSGVTACHNLLAMAHAGLGASRLYPGSWSEWSADPARPVERS